MHTPRHKFHLLKLAVAAAVATGLCWGAFARGIKAGDPMPDLSQAKLEGKVPDGLKGKVILLDFWASWCEPCKASFPVMDELQKRYGPKGLVVVAINVDEKRTDMEAFLKKNTASFAVLRDAAQKLVAQADVATMPSSFVIDQAGKVRFVHTGFHGEQSKKKYEQEIESLLKK
jgi:cytochrome c biogenesis protein CcmG/thiol:disulfide interchange protein DsbE